MRASITSGPVEVFRFGQFELEGDGRELRCDGKPVAIQRKALAVLLHLVRHAPRVVKRDELLADVWRDQVVGYDALNTAMRAVRRALGDTGRAQSFIRTVHGIGYSFNAPVERVALAPREFS